MRRFDELSEEEKTERYMRLARKALVGYGLAGDLAYVANGTSVVFRLRAGGSSFAVRVCIAGRDHAPLQRELLWLAALGRDTTLVVPEPVLALTGELFRSVSIEGVPGTRACMVLRWIDGVRREAELTPAEVAAIGRLVAELHRHAETFSWPLELSPDRSDPAGRVVAAAEAVRPALIAPLDRDLVCESAALIAEAVGALGAEAGAVGTIHGGLRLRRLRLVGDVFGIFGFDRCRVGAYVEDLSALWAELAGREATPVLQSALLDGYQSARALPNKPERALRAFGALRALEEAAASLEALRRGRRPQGSALESVLAPLRQALRRDVAV